MLSITRVQIASAGTGRRRLHAIAIAILAAGLGGVQQGFAQQTLYRNSLNASLNTLSSVNGWSTSNSFSGQTPTAVTANDTLTFSNFWTPSNVSTVAWLDAAASASLTASSGTVSAWANRTGGSVTASQASSASRPTVVANAMNGNPVLRFDGSNDFLATGNLFSGSSDWSVFSVTRLSGGLNTNGRAAYTITAGGMVNGYTVLLARSDITNTLRTTTRANTDNLDSTSSSPSSSYSVGQTMVAGAQRSGTQALASWNGSTSGASVTLQTNFSAGSMLEVGRYYGDSLYSWQGDVAEIVVTNTFLSVADRQRLEGYLAWKWGTVASLPNDHPFKHAAPVSASETVFLGGNRSAAGLVFSGSGSATTIVGGTSGGAAANSMTLGSGGITVSAAAGATTLGQASGATVSLVVNADQSWTNDSSSLLRAFNGISRAAGDTTSRVLTVSGSGNTQLDGVIADGGASGVLGLTKGGLGRLALAANNTFTGATQITDGVLEVGATGGINTSSGITLNGATAELKYNSATALTAPITFTQGTISGTGAINTAVAAGSGAILSPGNSPGAQAYTSGLAWNPGGTYVWELNSLTGVAGTNWDILNVTGGLDLSALAVGSTFNLNLVTLTGSNTAGPLGTAYVPGSSHTFALASFDTLSVPTGFSFAANSNLTSLFTIGLSGWQGTQPAVGDISVRVNSAGTGIDLVIVPEPGAIALAGIGIAAAAWATRRRRVEARSAS